MNDLKKKYYLFFLILPLLLVVTAVYLNHARGPYWLGLNLDPDYVYLLNAANMANLDKVSHIDHPGTPVQVLGAVTLRILHFFNFSPDIDLKTDVLKRPEYYLKAVNAVMVAMNVFMLLLLGVVTYQLTRNTWLSLWLQAAPFFSRTIPVFGLTRVSPEPLLLFSGLLFVLLLVKFMHAFSSGEDKDKRKTRLIFFFALAAGLGAATKVTFLPLVIIPFLIFPGFKNKLVYFFSAIAGFILFTLPIIGMYHKFFNWIYNLLVHKKSYGMGETGVISLQQYVTNIKKLLTGELFFSSVLIAALVTAAVVLIIPGLRKASRRNIKLKLLTAVILSQLLGVLMVGKHPARHYLMPVLCLSGITVFLIFSLLKDLLNQLKAKENFHIFKLKVSYLFLSFMVFTAGAFFLVNPVNQIKNTASYKTWIKNKSLAVYRQAETAYKDYAKIYCYGSSSPAYALKFGDDYAGNNYTEALAQIYKDAHFYIREHFYKYHRQQRIPFGRIRSNYGGKVIFQVPKWKRFPGLKLKKVYKKGPLEAIFTIDPGTAEAISRAAAWIEKNIKKDSFLVVPGDLGMNTAKLQQDYNIVSGDFTDLKENYNLALFLENPYFLVPSSHHYQRKIKGLEDFQKKIVIQKEFPEKGPVEFSLGRLKVDNPPVYEEVKLWYPLKKIKEQISPYLDTLGIRGKFSLDFKREQDGNTLIVSNIEPGKGGRRVCQFGYRTGEKGFDMEIPEGRYIHLVVKAKIPVHLLDKENYLFISDFDGRWENERVYFSGSGWLTYLVSKRIRQHSKKFQLGFRFVPKSSKDRMMIKDVKVFISNNQ